MFYYNRMAEYKGHRFWFDWYTHVSFLMTDDVALAKRLGFKKRMEDYPHVFRKRVFSWQVKTVFDVTRTVEYREHRFMVFHYSCCPDEYHLTTMDREIAEALEFERYDQGTFDKAVPIGECTDVQDEIKVAHRRWF